MGELPPKCECTHGGKKGASTKHSASSGQELGQSPGRPERPEGSQTTGILP